MIAKQLSAITIDDLKNLLTSQVREGRTIEYKLLLPGHTDTDKKEFLADVSSFANSIGGEIFYGIDAKNGIPVAIKGVNVSNIDAEVLKFEQVIKDCLEPRIQFEIGTLSIKPDVIVMIIRIHKAWNSPHRVIYKAHNKFYSRNSAGKYELDTHELRTAFLLSETLNEQIRRFRTERISSIINNDSPLSIDPESILVQQIPKMVLHIIPIIAFNPEITFDLQAVRSNTALLPPMRCTGWNHRNTLEGFLTYAENPIKTYSYVQLYRNGIVEAAVEIEQTSNDDKTIPYWYESILVQRLRQYLKVMKQINISLPLFIFVSFVGTRDARLEVQPLYAMGNYRYNRDQIVLPEVMIRSYEDPIEQLLKSVLDMFWNAFGYPNSLNFDRNGNWRNNP